jgi:hypothetical protein
VHVPLNQVQEEAEGADADKDWVGGFILFPAYLAGGASDEL